MRNKNKHKHNKKTYKGEEIMSENNTPTTYKDIPFSKKGGYKKGSSYIYKSCHNGPKEIYKNLFLGSEREIEKEVCKFDVLVPLYCLDGTIWDTGFRGEILYYPVEDYGTLPKDVVETISKKIINRLNQNKKVAIFCLGGHGRTGYLASIVLGKLGIEDPIDFVRSRYCELAIESNSQIRQISEILRKPSLISKYEIKWEGYYLEGGSYFNYGKNSGGAYPDYRGYKDYRKSSNSYSPPITDEDELILFGESKSYIGYTPQKEEEVPQSQLMEPKYCCDCRNYKQGYLCKKFGVSMKPFEEACDDGEI